VPLRLRVCSLALALLLTTPLAALSAESGFAFLRLPVSVRSVGMGETGAALADGADAFFTNPAGLADPTGQARSSSPWGLAGEAAVSHHESFSIYRQDAITVNTARGREAIALHFSTFYSEAVDQRDEVGNLLGSFGLVDLAAQAGYARALSPAFRVGATAGYVRERIADAAAGTWALSGGAIWSPRSLPGFRAGATVRQLGGSPSFDVDGAKGEKVSLPLTAQGGVGYASALGARGRLALAADVRKAADQDATVHTGVEVGWSAIDVRAGGRFGTDVGHFTAGLGVTAGRFLLDYAFLPSGESIGNSHRVELRTRFGL